MFLNKERNVFNNGCFETLSIFYPSGFSLYAVLHMYVST